MPDITFTVTANQAQRIAASFGSPPNGVTPQEWVIQNTKAFWKQHVKTAEARTAQNVAYDAANAQVETDFSGF